MPVFTATDGTKFEDRNAWRRYEFETQYTFRNKSKETLIKVPGKIGGQPFDLSDLDECEVTLLDHCDQVQVDNVTNSRVFIGPCSESVFIRNCSDCTFTVACKQLRTRDCTNCTFALYSLTDPIIETSSNMKFAPFNGAYCGIEQHFKDAHLEPSNNHWSQVYDFNDPSKSGENWCLLKPSEEPPAWIVKLDDHMPNAASLGLCVNPVPRDAGFIQYDESGASSSSMQSFSFTTTQEQAQKAVEAVAPPVETPPPQAASGALPLPPPAPTQTTGTENQKVAVVKSAEPLAPPPPCPSASCCSTVKNVEPIEVDQTLTQQLQDVMTLT